jgi:hypothetical protein
VFWAATLRLARRAARGRGREPSALARDELQRLEARAKQRETRAQLLKLAGPIAAAMLGESALGLGDSRLVGALGAESLAGVGTATVVLFLSYAMGFGLMRGVKVRAAYAIGEGREGDGVRYAQAGAAVGVALGLLVFAATRAPEAIFLALGVAPGTARAAAEFTAARAWGAPAMFVVSAMVQYRQAVGDALVNGFFIDLNPCAVAAFLLDQKGQKGPVPAAQVQDFGALLDKANNDFMVKACFFLFFFVVRHGRWFS